MTHVCRSMATYAVAVTLILVTSLAINAEDESTNGAQDRVSGHGAKHTAQHVVSSRDMAAISYPQAQVQTSSQSSVAGDPIGAQQASSKALVPRPKPDVSSVLQFLPSGLRAHFQAQGTTASSAQSSAKSKSSTQTPKLRSLGLIPSVPTEPAAASKALREIQARRAAKSEGPTFPTAYDNSSGMPPTGDQGSQNSCVPWVVGYYMKSYQEAREHGWTLTDPAHQFSPRFIYNQIQGFDEGATLPQVLDVLVGQGCASLVDEPYDDTDYLTYPKAQSYKDAIPYRAQSYEYLGHGETYEIFDVIKALASAGEVVAVGIPI